LKVTFKLDVFEGPLDLLLHLIDKAEVDIYNIPIKEITDQYLAYIGHLQQMELDFTSDFLVMAATLLSIKSKLLLPKPPVIELGEGYGLDEDYDPRAELVQKLLEYRKYKEAAGQLRELEQMRSLVFTREATNLMAYVPVIQVNPVEGLQPVDLFLALQKVMRKQVNRHIVTKIERDERSVKDRIREVAAILQARGGKILFSRLFDEEEGTRQDIVVTFLAVLELMKQKQIKCFQHRLFDEIVIESTGGKMEVGLQTDEIDY
jgi:segregation and condensation protein A